MKFELFVNCITKCLEKHLLFIESNYVCRFKENRFEQ